MSLITIILNLNKYFLYCLSLVQQNSSYALFLKIFESLYLKVRLMFITYV